MSRASTLGDAIVADLNDQSFGIAFTAVRKYHTTPDTKALRNLAVTLMIPSMTHDIISSVGNDDTTSIVIIFQKQCKPEDNNTVDPLTDLVEKVADYFRDKNYGGSRWVSPTEIMPFYDLEDMVNSRVFSSAIRLTYHTVWK